MKRAPLIEIDLSSPVAAYEQIADAIRALLVMGELAPGAALPTVRQLAMDLSVHHNTVAQSYRILAAEGWLDLRRGRGARVVTRSKPSRKNRGAQRMFRSRLKGLLAKAVAEGLAPGLIAHELTLHAGSVKGWDPTKGG